MVEKQKEIIEKTENKEESEVEKSPKEEGRKDKASNEFDKESWAPKTGLGKQVKEGKIKDINEILDNGLKILEPEIVDILLPGLSNELLLIGQSKGKFGGGQRRVFKQTQKKTQEGNKPKFATVAVVGNENGIVGIGYGKSKETVPAREKSQRNAKLNIIKIRRGNGSWEDNSTKPNTIPFAVEGKCGSVRIRLMPAPNGTGLKAQKELQKILKLAGIKDIWSKTKGQTKSSINLIYACFDALKNLMYTRLTEKTKTACSVVEGAIKEEAKAEEIIENE